MKILMVGHYPPHGGGIANHLDNLVRELRERHEVYILTYGPIKPRDFERRFVYQVRVPKIMGIRGISFSILAAKKIVELHEKFRFDIIHAHFVGTTSYAGVLARKKIRVPLVVTAHGSDLDFMSKLPLGRYFVKRSLIQADAVITVSHYLAKKALYLGAEDVYIIPNGIKLLKSHNLKKEFITFIGSLREYKDPAILIQLARIFPAENFLIVGEGPLRRRLEKNSPPNVRFLGYRTDIDRILSQTKILILPSKREGFGLVVIEANSLKVPVIGRNIGGIPELIRNKKNGILFENFEDLVEALRSLLEKKEARRMGHVGFKISKRYQWKKISNEIEGIYIKLRSP